MLAAILIALACIAVAPARAYAGEAVERSLSAYLDRVEMPSELSLIHILRGTRRGVRR